MAQRDLVQGILAIKQTTQVCDVCLIGKHSRAPFLNKAKARSTLRLNLLHMDLCGPMRVASINGKKYILVIIDDYSRYTWTLFLRSMDETPEVLKEFLTMIQRNLQALMITTKDHSLEQVHGNPSRPVQTRRQLVADPEMCMFALIVSTAEPKNIKEAMADFAWIEAMQEELHQHIGEERVQQARLQTLKSDFEMLHMKEDETIDTFTGKLTTLVNKVASLGHTIEDQTLVRKLLNAVPDRYLQIVASIEQYSVLSEMTLEEAVGRLKTYEERIKYKKGKQVDNQEKLMFTRHENKGKYFRGHERGKHKFSQGRNHENFKEERKEGETS
nr:zinc finger, CCHC-type [Tanacetum cinerariifolium]